MRQLSSANLSALADRAIVARDFLWIVARDRTSGESVADGLWSDAGTITADVINPDTGLSVSRTWYGSGTLIQIDDIPLVANVTVQQIAIRMSQINARVETLIRQYDVRQGRVEIYRGLFNPSTRALVAPAPCRFVGFVDQCEIKTPRAGEVGEVVLTCTSHTQEMTRSNPDTRSHESQTRRSATDDFYRDVSVVASWEMFWGRSSGRLRSKKKRKLDED